MDLPTGATLAREGEILDSFWVIREGQAELMLPEGNDPPSVLLRPGEYVLIESLKSRAEVALALVAVLLGIAWKA